MHTFPPLSTNAPFDKYFKLHCLQATVLFTEWKEVRTKRCEVLTGEQGHSQANCLISVCLRCEHFYLCISIARCHFKPNKQKVRWIVVIWIPNKKSIFDNKIRKSLLAQETDKQTRKTKQMGFVQVENCTCIHHIIWFNAWYISSPWLIRQ